ncbi:LuxR family transcriptional regulator [Novosphingobium sp.]|uniref:LuxR family transcriptional regulator n=1 Tax=Novosphingobium sp. TaxID=1874826 RepID=UPI002736C837|nr:LuxR family transcriptional regulator [Novosphingobium sp.]MDP3906742.1 LuxR family transcriptional regulator [Novosphingobium sp.]
MGLKLAEEFASNLVKVETEAALGEALGQVSRRLEFDHFALTLQARTSTDGPPDLLLHDYPDEWARVYINFELAGRDPVQRACDKSLTGFEWDHIERLIPLTRGDRQMLAVGRECGIGDGYTIPRHLPGEARGTCSFAVRPGANLPRPLLMATEIIGALGLACAHRVSGLVRKPSRPALSDRQRECLLWAARGKTAAETAIILGISIETVIQHLKLARERYDVHCRQSLILNALFDGLIGFSDIFRRRRPD